MAAPVAEPIGTARGGWPPLLAGVAATLVAAGALAVAWPADDPPAPVDPDAPPSTLMSAEIAASLPPAVTPGIEVPDLGDLPFPVPQGPPADLFGDGPAVAVAEVLAASGPDELLELAIYPEYLFVAYRAPGTDEIDRRQWRGQVGAATPNVIDDRVDASTGPKLFTLAELGPALELLPSMVADAPTRFTVPVEVTHVIVERFLPFDDRVLVRVYARPADGRRGGGYVTYTTTGTFQQVVG